MCHRVCQVRFSEASGPRLRYGTRGDRGSWGILAARFLGNPPEPPPIPAQRHRAAPRPRGATCHPAQSPGPRGVARAQTRGHGSGPKSGPPDRRRRGRAPATDTRSRPRRQPRAARCPGPGAWPGHGPGVTAAVPRARRQMPDRRSTGRAQTRGHQHGPKGGPSDHRPQEHGPAPAPGQPPRPQERAARSPTPGARAGDSPRSTTAAPGAGRQIADAGSTRRRQTPGHDSGARSAPPDARAQERGPGTDQGSRPAAGCPGPGAWPGRPGPQTTRPRGRVPPRRDRGSERHREARCPQTALLEGPPERPAGSPWPTLHRSGTRWQIPSVALRRDTHP